MRLSRCIGPTLSGGGLDHNAPIYNAHLDSVSNRQVHLTQNLCRKNNSPTVSDLNDIRFHLLS